MGLKNFTRLALWCSTLLLASFIKAEESIPSPTHEGTQIKFSQTPAGNEVYEADLNDQLAWIHTFGVQANKFIQWRIHNLGMEAVAKKLLEFYNKSDYRQYYARFIDAIQMYVEESKYKETMGDKSWTDVDPKNLELVSAVGEFLYSKSTTGHVSNSVFLTLSKNSDEENKLRAEVESYNKAHSIVSSSGQLRAGQYFIDEVKKAVDLKTVYDGQELSITDALTQSQSVIPHD